MTVRRMPGGCVDGDLVKTQEVGLQRDSKGFFCITTSLRYHTVVGIIPRNWKVNVIYFLFIGWHRFLRGGLSFKVVGAQQ